MNVSVFGLGYVGVVTSACLVRDGFAVTGVDVNADKVTMVSEGQAPIIELGLSELLKAGVASGRLTATTSAADAVGRTDVSLVCVGTPSADDGSLDLSYVYKVCEEIGRAVARHGQPHVVILRSTVRPGTTSRCRQILQDHSAGVPVHVAFNPEFLREGSAIRDFDGPPYTVIGTEDTDAEQAVRALYAGVDAPFLVMDPAEAELVKATANAWHATKIVFANEIGRLAKAYDVNGRHVMETLKKDTKLNISPSYLSPGFAYGGSCLPKDVRALIAVGASEDVQLPLLRSLAESNRAQIDLALRQVLALGKRRIGLLGVAFKPGTDDLRESPGVILTHELMEHGLEIRILDEAVHTATLMGSNKRFVEQAMPRLPDLLVDSADELLRHAEALVITHGSARLRAVVERSGPDVPVMDLAGLFDTPPKGTMYDGIAW